MPRHHEPTQRAEDEAGGDREARGEVDRPRPQEANPDAPTETGNEAPAASLKAAPDTAKPGAKLKVSGANFAPGAIELLWDDTPLRTAKTGERGGFQLELRVPAEAEAGEHRLTARDKTGATVDAIVRVEAVASKGPAENADEDRPSDQADKGDNQQPESGPRLDPA
jgi:hypothetical protein